MKLMQVWIVCFLIFFGAAEFYQWLQGVTLPMPVFIITGALLAVASNANKVLPKTGLRSMQPLATSAVASIDRSAEAAPLPPTVVPSRQYAGSPHAGPQLPNLTPTLQSISFTIEKSRSVSEENH